MAQINRNLRKLSNGEQLWLCRKALGQTQVEAAQRSYYGIRCYVLAELDRHDPITILGHWSHPCAREKLTLARRRYGRDLRETAHLAGVSHRTLLLWEQAADNRLIRFWERRGFTGF